LHIRFMILLDSVASLPKHGSISPQRRGGRRRYAGGRFSGFVKPQ